jgi:hypothetical protein
MRNTKVMIKRIWKRTLKKFKKHQTTITVLSFIISIISILQPFIIGEQITLIQRIRVIELPTITEAHASPQQTIHISASISAIVEYPNGTVKQLAP